MPMMKAETSPGAPGACASHQHHHHQVGSPVNSTKSRRSLKFINLPSGTLALLATIGFLSVLHHIIHNNNNHNISLKYFPIIQMMMANICPGHLCRIRHWANICFSLRHVKFISNLI
jgi:hypothetical protein